MGTYRAMSIDSHNLETFARASVGNSALFNTTYDRAREEYETQWEFDPLRYERDEIMNAATRFLWCFSDKMIVTADDGSAKTVPADDLYETLNRTERGYVEASTPIATIAISDTMITCRSRDRLVHPLAELIMATGYGAWRKEHDAKTVDTLTQDEHRPLDLLSSMRAAYDMLCSESSRLKRLDAGQEPSLQNL